MGSKPAGMIVITGACPLPALCETTTRAPGKFFSALARKKSSAVGKIFNDENTREIATMFRVIVDVPESYFR